MQTSNTAARTKPSFVDHPAHWTGATIAATRWRRTFEAPEIAALETMVAVVSRRIGDDLSALATVQGPAVLNDEFAPPAFQSLTAALRRELIEGKGFVVLRGLPLDRWSRRDAFIAYWLLGVGLGVPVPSNAGGDMFGHVMDLGVDIARPDIRGYDTNVQLSYHCDQCDVVGLLCLQKSKRGGLSKLVSAMALYEVIRERRPDLLRVLCEPFYFSRLGEEVEGQLPWYVAPMFDDADGGLHCAAGFGHIGKGHKLPGAPALSDAQHEAMLLVEAVCPSIEFAMSFEPGDIQLLNNGLILHTRTAFEDWPEPERRRHLLRLWLRIPEMHHGAAYFENWRHGISPADGNTRFRLSPW